MKRFELINSYIKKNNYKRYLEIGVRKGSCFNNVQCDYKVAVDPNPDGIKIQHVMESDKFFEKNEEKFDIIFIDGLHFSEQVYRDIVNSLKFLNEGGTVICHDMIPRGYKEQLYPMEKGTFYWNGDCWKAWLWLRCERDDLNMFVVNTDEGCGVISKGKQEKLSYSRDLSYENFEKNKNEILNIVEVKDLKV